MPRNVSLPSRYARVAARRAGDPYLFFFTAISCGGSLGWFM